MEEKYSKCFVSMCLCSMVRINWNQHLGMKSSSKKKIKTLNSLIKEQISYKDLKSLFCQEHIHVCISFV